jgi:ArsR family transcriptional regulator
MPTVSPTAPVIPLRTKGCCHPLTKPLPEREAAALAQTFQALGDPTRVRMVQLLAEAAEPVCVCDFTATIRLGQPTVSHHLAKLRQAGIVTSVRRGLWSFYHLDPEMPAAARAAIQSILAASR